MFAGIVRGIGRIAGITDRGRDRRLDVDCDGARLGRPRAGASVAVNGVCLTALEDVDRRLTADVSAETLAVTTLGRLAPGALVNLEPSLRLGDPVDGHFVYGHVDAVGEVRAVEPDGRSLRIAFALPAALARYVVPKGSIAVDGVSLTVNRVDAGGFWVNVIPHTQEQTICAGYTPGTTVNIEVDMMARYLERLGLRDEPGITREMLQEHGFARRDQ